MSSAQKVGGPLISFSKFPYDRGVAQSATVTLRQGTMTNLVADARLGFSAWRKSPTFTAIAILSMAMGIGANAAIFTLVDQVLLRVLPVRASHELMQVTFVGSRYGHSWGDGSELSWRS
jgi:hypothetical protein